MLEKGVRREFPELKQIVAEASRALAELDAGRLDELAMSCRALNRDLAQTNAVDRKRLARESRDAAGDMAVFSRVLSVTRANLNVIQRLRELRAGRFEYSEQQARWGQPGTQHGDN
jgi:hypothetical protein